MKIQKFILIRIAIVLIALILIYNGAYYTLPQYLQQDSFSPIAEINRILELSLIFLALFLLFLLAEIYMLNKREQSDLRKPAIIFSLFIAILVIALIYAKENF